LGAGGARDGQRLLAAVQLPSESDLLRSGVVLLGDRVDRSVERLALVSSGDGARVPGGEDDAGVLGDLPHGGAEADGDVVVDGDGGDVGDRHGGAELLGTHVGEADVADEAVVAQPRERVDDLLEWSVGHSRRVQVVEVDVVQAEPARTHVRRVAEVVRVPDGAHVGVLGAAADEPALGGETSCSGYGYNASRMSSSLE